ncbi:MAG: prepilin peptidase [Methylococcales bacterium]
MEHFTAIPIEPWILSGWALVCGGFDVCRRRLPNLLTLGGAAAALAMLVATGYGWLETSWSSCTGAAIAAALLTLPAYAVRRLGAGDVKLLVSMGLLGGLQALSITYVCAGLLVGFITVLWIQAYRWEFWFAYRFAQIGIMDFSIPEPKGRSLPFGFALAIGFLIAVSDPNIHFLNR